MLSLEVMEAFIAGEPDFRRDDVCDTLFLAIQVSDQFEEHSSLRMHMATAHQLADAAAELVRDGQTSIGRCQRVRDALVRFRYSILHYVAGELGCAAKFL